MYERCQKIKEQFRTWNIQIKVAVEKSLKDILNANEIPAANEVQCGNYRDLSLFGAKEYAKYVLEQGFSLNIYGE